jgi:hypothetical protein
MAGLDEVLQLGGHDLRGANMPAQRTLGDDLLELAVGIQDLLPLGTGRDEGLQLLTGQPVGAHGAHVVRSLQQPIHEWE